MFSAGTICSLLLLSVLWVDVAMAGSSFLSPEHQKAQQRKESKKPPAKLQPRAIDGWLHQEDTDQADGAEDELEIRTSATKPRLHWRDRQPGPTLRGYRRSHAASPPHTCPYYTIPMSQQPGIPQSAPLDSQEDCKFNAPFDMAIKLFGAQYQQHSRALRKFLQDILWEEAKEALADQ
ncbi:appetite-regulating hormone isoform X1 [Urocitellus parryii]